MQREIAGRALSRTQQQREAVLLSFCDPLPAEFTRLRGMSAREWKRLLYWLDTSGLALYFLDRMTELRLCGFLPQPVLARLQDNLRGNTVRNEAMGAESAALHGSFQEAGVSCATLKGFSLWPLSVPNLALRSQLDLDFLVAEECAPEARQILEARGYRLHAISGRTWEFKVGRLGIPLEEQYQARPDRSVELHLERRGAGRDALLGRIERRELYGYRTPVLSPVDLFLGQGLHLYKHVCHEFTRTAHMLEFRRHVMARYHDVAFWSQLRESAEQSATAPMALGLVTLLITRLMGEFAPQALRCWSVDRVPAGARLWLERYGRHTAYSSVPGSKLYLLLQRELQPAGVTAKQSLREALLPHRLPPALTQGGQGTSVHSRLAHRAKQMRSILLRLRFHVVEGVRYLCESSLWQRRIRLLRDHPVAIAAEKGAGANCPMPSADG